MSVHRFELSDFASAEGVWFYVCDTDAEAGSLTNLPRSAVVLSKQSAQMWAANSSGTPQAVGGAGAVAHADTTGQMAGDHHVAQHDHTANNNTAQGTLSHASLTNVSNNQAAKDAHHPEAHAHAEYVHTHPYAADTHTHAGGSSPALMQFNLNQSYPFDGTPATLTPTAHGATVARVFPFDLPGSLTLARVLIRTNAALANSLRVGLYNSTGQQVWTAGPLATVATGWVNVTANNASLTPGTYYWVSTNNNVVSTTATYAVTPAAGLTLPRWGTVPATLGAMPASINPAAITSTTGGWMAYVLLSAV